MAKNDNLSLQAFMRLEAAPDISQQKVYEACHRILSWSDSVSRRKTPGWGFRKAQWHSSGCLMGEEILLAATTNLGSFIDAS